MSTRRHQWPPRGGIGVDASLRLSMGEYSFFLFVVLAHFFGACYTLVIHVGRYHSLIHRHSSTLPSYLHRSHFHFIPRPYSRPRVLFFILTLPCFILQ